MELTGKLPDGITSVKNVDLGVGPCLEVTLATGFTVYIDALRLADHICQVGVFRTEKLDHGEGYIAGIAFDPSRKTEIGYRLCEVGRVDAHDY